MKRIATLLSITFLLGGIISTTFVGSTYAANTPEQDACQGVDLTAGTNTCGDNGGQLNSVLTVVVNLLSVIVGIAAVIMIIIAGLRFTTSGGNAQGVAGARSALIYALVGLVIVALAQVIVHFILGQVSTAT